MNGAPVGPRSETLGERLFGLVQGDPCPCCGARLVADTGRMGAPELICPECGCEIHGPAPRGSDAVDSTGPRVLCVAA